MNNALRKGSDNREVWGEKTVCLFLLCCSFFFFCRFFVDSGNGERLLEKKIYLLWEKRVFICFTAFSFYSFGKKHCVAEEHFFFSSLLPFFLQRICTAFFFRFYFLSFIFSFWHRFSFFSFRKNKSFPSKMYFFPLFRKRQNGSISGFALCAHSN